MDMDKRLDLQTLCLAERAQRQPGGPPHRPLHFHIGFFGRLVSVGHYPVNVSEFVVTAGGNQTVQAQLFTLTVNACGSCDCRRRA
jgi:hypothetical protein